jgi:hypothetical protein
VVKIDLQNDVDRFADGKKQRRENYRRYNGQIDREYDREPVTKTGQENVFYVMHRISFRHQVLG